MTAIKKVLAGLAATGLLVAQPAMAATASSHRGGSATGDSEELAGVPGAAIPFLIALAIGAIVVVVSASNDNDNPVSP